MIKQKHIAIKSASTTLTYAEMGDIVCDSAGSLIISIPAPNKGLWYRISNVGSGNVVVFYNSMLTSLKQTEQCLCLSNGSSSWFLSKSGGTMTKDEIEDILTGEITSHSHPVEAYELPQATAAELGGVKAKEKTSETTEVAIDSFTGKLYVPAPDEAENGIPAGGTAGQVLSKVDGTDYNSQWIDSGNAESLLAKPIVIPTFTGKDGYVLAYDETMGEFYLKAYEGGGSDAYSIRTFKKTTKPVYQIFENILSTNRPAYNPAYWIFQDIVAASDVDV